MTTDQETTLNIQSASPDLDWWRGNWELHSAVAGLLMIPTAQTLVSAHIVRVVGILGAQDRGLTGARVGHVEGPQIDAG